MFQSWYLEEKAVIICCQANIKNGIFPCSYPKNSFLLWKEPWTWLYNLLRSLLQIKISIFRNSEKGCIYNLIHRRYHSIFFFIFTVIFVPFGTIENENDTKLDCQRKMFLFWNNFKCKTACIFVYLSTSWNKMMRYMYEMM